MTSDIIMRFCMLCALNMPFSLPHMHERYFYIADVLTVIYAVIYPKRWILPTIVITSSFLLYGVYLFGFTWMNAAYAAFPMFISVAIVFFDVLQEIKENVLT